MTQTTHTFQTKFSIFPKQEFTSKNTSMNKLKLPRLFHYIDYDKLRGKTILDIGCGQYTEHIKSFLANFGIKYYAYDPHWQDPFTNAKALTCSPNFITCSNTLNVIKEEEIIASIKQLIRSYNVPYVISVYDGDGSGIGKQSQDDCWQRNESIWDYKTPIKEFVKYNLITNDTSYLANRKF